MTLKLWSQFVGALACIALFYACIALVLSGFEGMHHATDHRLWAGGVAFVLLLAWSVLTHLDTRRRWQKFERRRAYDRNLRTDEHKIPDGTEVRGTEAGPAFVDEIHAPSAERDGFTHYNGATGRKIIHIADRRDLTADLYQRSDGTIARLTSVTESTRHLNRDETRRWVQREADRLTAEAATLLKLIEDTKETK